eukprot:UC4_evm7s754
MEQSTSPRSIQSIRSRRSRYHHNATNKSHSDDADEQVFATVPATISSTRSVVGINPPDSGDSDSPNAPHTTGKKKKMYNLCGSTQDVGRGHVGPTTRYGYVNSLVSLVVYLYDKNKTDLNHVEKSDAAQLRYHGTSRRPLKLLTPKYVEYMKIKKNPYRGRRQLRNMKSLMSLIEKHAEAQGILERDTEDWTVEYAKKIYERVVLREMGYLKRVK